MNKSILMGRLTKDPVVRYSQAAEPVAIAKYTLAVNRSFKASGEPEADFINITAFGKRGQFAEKYFKKGMQVVVVGAIRTGSYEKDGRKVYTTEVVVEEQHFAEGKRSFVARPADEVGPGANTSADDFDDFNEDDIPFN